MTEIRGLLDGEPYQEVQLTDELRLASLSEEDFEGLCKYTSYLPLRLVMCQSFLRACL